MQTQTHDHLRPAAPPNLPNFFLTTKHLYAAACLFDENGTKILRLKAMFFRESPLLNANTEWRWQESLAEVVENRPGALRRAQFGKQRF